MERTEYVKMVLQNQLLTDTYRLIGPGELDFKEQLIRKHIRINI